jgi:CBS-domain-containing membrane protein
MSFLAQPTNGLIGEELASVNGASVVYVMQLSTLAFASGPTFAGAFTVLHPQSTFVLVKR